MHWSTSCSWINILHFTVSVLLTLKRFLKLWIFFYIVINNHENKYHNELNNYIHCLNNFFAVIIEIILMAT